MARKDNYELYMLNIIRSTYVLHYHEPEGTTLPESAVELTSFFLLSFSLRFIVVEAKPLLEMEGRNLNAEGPNNRTEKYNFHY